MIKDALINAPILKRPDFSKPFKLYTDTSSFGLGAILAQEDDTGEYIITYASRGTRDAEAFYRSIQLECLGIVWAIKHFKHYLIGKKFTLVTDHTALRWL